MHLELASLLERLAQLALQDREWEGGICSAPVEAVVSFEGADSIEGFSDMNRLEHKFEKEWKMPILEHCAQNVDLDRVCVVAIYPSGALRSIPARLSRDYETLKVQIKHLVLLLDPDNPNPTDPTVSFNARATLFAVVCGI